MSSNHVDESMDSRLTYKTKRAQCDYLPYRLATCSKQFKLPEDTSNFTHPPQHHVVFETRLPPNQKRAKNLSSKPSSNRMISSNGSEVQGSETSPIQMLLCNPQRCFSEHPFSSPTALC